MRWEPLACRDHASQDAMRRHRSSAPASFLAAGPARWQGAPPSDAPHSQRGLSWGPSCAGVTPCCCPLDILRFLSELVSWKRGPRGRWGKAERRRETPRSGTSHSFLPQRTRVPSLFSFLSEISRPLPAGMTTERQTDSGAPSLCPCRAPRAEAQGARGLSTRRGAERKR